jgi:hypothetical protein
MSDNIKKVSDHIEDLILNLASDKLNPSKLFSLTIQLIEYVEDEYPSLKGDEKKALLIEAFKDILSVTSHPSLSPTIKKEIATFVDEDLDTVVDSVIQVSRGDFRINEKQQALLMKLCLKLFHCCLKKKNNSARP